MIQTRAKVINNEQLLGGFERQNAGTHFRPEARNVLGTWLIRLECPEIAAAAQPGQYVMVRCGYDGVLPRPFSINRVDASGNLALFYTVWADGIGTQWLAQRERDEPINIFGPLGNGFNIRPGAKKLLLVAGGNGIASLTFLAHHVAQQGLGFTLLRGASGEAPSQQHYPAELLPPGIDDWTITTSPDGAEGMVTDLLKPQLVEHVDQIFACGPTAMYRAMAKMPELKGKSTQVSLETHMGCGRGVCYGCTVKTRSGQRLACQDGPVFDLDEVLWDELPG